MLLHLSLIVRKKKKTLFLHLIIIFFLEPWDFNFNFTLESCMLEINKIYCQNPAVAHIRLYKIKIKLYDIEKFIILSQFKDV